MSLATVLLALITAAAGAIVGMSRAHLPSTTFWGGQERLILTAIIVVSFLPLLQVVVSEFGERKKRRMAELENDLHVILAATLIDLHEIAGADWKKTGIQVFRVRRWWLILKIQARAARLRLSHIAPSGVKWKRGKGLIGKCWATGLPVTKDLHAHFAPHRRIDEAGWANLPQSIEKYGLTYAEFKKIHDRYGLVVAFPLTRADKYIGCITADMPPECSAGANEAKILETLSAAAPSIAAVIDKKRRAG